MDFLDVLLEAPTPKAPSTPTDYTADDDTDTSSTDDTTTDDTSTDDSTDDAGGDTTDGPTDYTATDDTSDPSTDGSDSTDDGSGDDSTDDSSDDSTDDSTDDDGTDNNNPDEQNNRVLLEDFSNMYYLIKNTITKLSNVDKSNILINKIVTQISSNLGLLKKQVFDYITFSFSTGKYVTNLYKYNYFLEAFRINVEMLKKISIFIPNSQNN